MNLLFFFYLHFKRLEIINTSKRYIFVIVLKCKYAFINENIWVSAKRHSFNLQDVTVSLMDEKTGLSVDRSLPASHYRVLSPTELTWKQRFLTPFPCFHYATNELENNDR